MIKLKLLFAAVLLFAGAFVFAQTKIAIVGGGMAGVTCAHYISQYDTSATVILFEKEKQLGGNAQTVEVKNAKNQLTKVDVGPQYFVEGPWNDYISFLNETLGKDPYEYESMKGTLLIQTRGRKRPLLVSPLNGNLRGEKLSELIQLKRFNDEAYKAYNSPDKWKGVSIEKWVEQLDFTTQYKQTIIYPFLAASLGTSIGEIKTTSVLDIVKLFAFRKPKASNKFHIMTDGMGTLIQRVGVKLQERGVQVKTESPVYKITKSDHHKWLVTYKHNNTEHTELVDFVVLATHADQASKILNQEPELQEIATTLKQLKYFEVQIALHTDSSYVNLKKPAFLNINTNEKNELMSSTMNLSMISKRLKGIYKSWLTEEDILKMKASGKLLHVTKFYHPLITTDFVKHLGTMHRQVAGINNLYLSGGWSEGLETQNSAIISGRHALDKYKQFVQKN